MADRVEGPAGVGLTPPDEAAISRAFAVQPVLSRIEAAGSAIGLPRDTLLHAGPAFRSIDDIPAPIMNSACLSAVLADLVDAFDEAEAQIRAGAIVLKPAQDYDVVTPLAAVVSVVTPLNVVVDGAGGDAIAYAPVHDGGVWPTREGQRSEEVFQQLRWTSVAVADRFDAALKDPIPLLPLARFGLENGDDCHGRTMMASRALVGAVRDRLPFEVGNAVTEFFDLSPGLFLNVWMAATKCIMLAGAGLAGSSFVTAAGGNGVETGIQVSGKPGNWFTVRAKPPAGPIDSSLADRALGAIGDSAVIEALGLGAMAWQCAPEQRKALGRFLPANYEERKQRLLAAEHPAFAELELRLGITARSAAGFGDGPVVGLGILDREGIAGRIGGGLYAMPPDPFRAAVSALEAGS